MEVKVLGACCGNCGKVVSLIEDVAALHRAHQVASGRVGMILADEVDLAVGDRLFQLVCAEDAFLTILAFLRCVG